MALLEREPSLAWLTITGERKVVGSMGVDLVIFVLVLEFEPLEVERLLDSLEVELERLLDPLELELERLLVPLDGEVASDSSITTRAMSTTESAVAILIVSTFHSLDALCSRL